MKCAECGSFQSAFRAASVRYAAATFKLDQMAGTTLLKDPVFRKQDVEVISARLDYKMAKEAYRDHREGHKGDEN